MKKCFFRSLFLILLELFLSFNSNTANVDAEKDKMSKSERERLLLSITEITSRSSGGVCNDKTHLEFVLVPIDTSIFESAIEKVDLISALLEDAYDLNSKKSLPSEGFLESVVCQTLISSPQSTEVSLTIQENQARVFLQKRDFVPSSRDAVPVSSFVKRQDKKCDVKTMGPLKPDPWYKSFSQGGWDKGTFQELGNRRNTSKGNTLTSGGRWSWPYYHCEIKRWMISYVRMFGNTKDPVISSGNTFKKSSGYIRAEFDVSSYDINQCSSKPENQEEISENFKSNSSTKIINFFADTHKCHQNSSECVFEGGKRWNTGGYFCICKKGFYSQSNSTFRGEYVEVAWSNKQDTNSSSYASLYICKQCHEGCENCTDGSPCLAETNMPFRIALLTISMMCIFLTMIMMCLVYHYKSVKVFKVASPAFLEICLLGCIVMYLEMATIFPVLDMFSCICTKWARHLGFCITFSSLLMKTWRVSLTYRVKSAHKIKLTDKQLLQWMTPILLIMIVYLAAWTISDPPKGQDWKESSTNLLFKQCTYNAWDHCLATGELIFLLWGVKVCYGVRKAESFFDEAKCISYAVYNITLINILMALLHLFIFPHAGPDLKYFFGFVRTQCSTTTTIALVFGPKLLRVLKGTGDLLDNRARAKGVTASFSINGIGGNGDEPPDPLEENEELKEEIQKLAAQIEFMKIVHMEMNNRHLKPKPGGYFTEKNVTLVGTGQNATTSLINRKASLPKAEISENSSSILNPQLDCHSEKV